MWKYEKNQTPMKFKWKNAPWIQGEGQNHMAHGIESRKKLLSWIVLNNKRNRVQLKMWEMMIFVYDDGNGKARRVVRKIFYCVKSEIAFQLRWMLRFLMKSE